MYVCMYLHSLLIHSSQRETLKCVSPIHLLPEAEQNCAWIVIKSSVTRKKAVGNLGLAFWFPITNVYDGNISKTALRSAPERKCKRGRLRTTCRRIVEGELKKRQLNWDQAT